MNEFNLHVYLVSLLAQQMKKKKTHVIYTLTEFFGILLTLNLIIYGRDGFHVETFKIVGK